MIRQLLAAQQFCRSTRRPVIKQFTQPIRKRPIPSAIQKTSTAVPQVDNTAAAAADLSAAATVTSLRDLVSRPALVIGRQMEYLNIFLGFEQANRYVIYDAHTATPLAYILEDQSTLLSTIQRQIFRSHRPFTATIMSTTGQTLLRLRRPFQLINSRLYVSDSDESELLGEVHQQWHLLRRKYDLFLGTKQFAEVDAPFLAWDFTIQDATGSAMASVNKNFTGLGRELFTDSSQYVVRFEDIPQSSQGSEQQAQQQPSTAIKDSNETALVERRHQSLTVEERALTLACAISIDYDYFSRHSTGGGLFNWFPFAFGGDQSAAPVTEDENASQPDPVDPMASDQVSEDFTSNDSDDNDDDDNYFANDDDDDNDFDGDAFDFGGDSGSDFGDFFGSD